MEPISFTQDELAWIHHQIRSSKLHVQHYYPMRFVVFVVMILSLILINFITNFHYTYRPALQDTFAERLAQVEDTETHSLITDLITQMEAENQRIYDDATRYSKRYMWMALVGVAFVWSMLYWKRCNPSPPPETLLAKMLLAHPEEIDPDTRHKIYETHANEDSSDGTPAV